MGSIHSRDPYTGELVDQAPWMLNPPGERMPFPAGRYCSNMACAQELSRYDRGPRCYCCEIERQREQRRQAEEAA
jgi:hypothetical protein